MEVVRKRNAVEVVKETETEVQLLTEQRWKWEGTEVGMVRETEVGVERERKW